MNASLTQILENEHDHPKYIKRVYDAMEKAMELIVKGSWEPAKLAIESTTKLALFSVRSKSYLSSLHQYYKYRKGKLGEITPHNTAVMSGKIGAESKRFYKQEKMAIRFIIDFIIISVSSEHLGLSDNMYDAIWGKLIAMQRKEMTRERKIYVDKHKPK